MDIFNQNKGRLFLLVIPPGGLRMIKLNLSLKHLLLTIAVIFVLFSLSIFAVFAIPSGFLDNLRNFMLVRSLTFERNHLSKENQELNKEIAKLRQELATVSYYDKRIQAGLEEILTMIDKSANHNILVERPAKAMVVKNNLIAYQREIQKSPALSAGFECSLAATNALGGAESYLKKLAGSVSPSSDLNNLNQTRLARENNNLGSKSDRVEKNLKKLFAHDHNKHDQYERSSELKNDFLSGEVNNLTRSPLKSGLQVAYSTLFLTDFGHPLLKFYSLGDFLNLNGDLSKQPDDLLSLKALSKKELYANVRSIATILKTTPIGSPFNEGLLTSGYGIRRSPFGRGYRFHEGIDLAAPYGTVVSSVADGTVSYVGYNSAYGLMIQIDHNARHTTRYAHLSRTLVKSGQMIKRGDPIGMVGSSGESTGPHLHFEIFDKNQSRDPAYFIWFADHLDKKLALYFK